MVDKEHKGLIMVLECGNASQSLDSAGTLFDDLGYPDTMATNALAATVADVLERDYGIPAQAVTSMNDQAVGFKPPSALLTSLRDVARLELQRNDFIGQMSRTPELYATQGVKVVPSRSRIKLIVK